MNFWALALLLLVFISKLSLAFLGLPWQASFFVFQHGLHPYLNLFFNFLLGLPVVLGVLEHHRKFQSLGRVYRTQVFLLFMLLFLETLLQFALLEHMRGPYSWAALLSTSWLIFLFGLILPTVLEPRVALRFLSHCSLVFVVLSLGLWLARPDLTFKGGRFIGIFKHIPYMVTCASLGVILTLGRFQEVKHPLARLLYSLGIALSFVALLLTGTRSALAAAVMACVLWVLRVPALKARDRYLKYALSLVIMVSVLLFGNAMAEYARDVATGKKSLVEREAQDGVASRMAEVERGWEYFQKSPWLGQGLLAKFDGTDSLEVNSYDSFKDPHNIFVSAGVVGGWPFIVWTILFLALLLLTSFRAMISQDPVMQVFGIYALVQIPILIIYHWHLSLGGMADRFYWLVFGYLALSRINWVR